MGGGGGRYHVMLTEDAHTESESWRVAERRDQPESANEILTVGGQPGRFPSRQIVSLEIALSAARAFYETGEPASDLVWDESP